MSNYNNRIKVANSDWEITRLQHIVSAGEIVAGVFNENIIFTAPFSDAYYTIAQGLTCSVSRLTNDYSPGDCHNLAAGGFSTSVYIGAGAVAGDIVTINTLAIHDN